MDSEIIICPKCKTEFDLQYVNDEVVSRSWCNCVVKQKLTNGLKPLDYAFKKINEVLNEKSKSGTRKVSKSTKASR